MNVIFRLIGLMLLFIVVMWYGNINHTTEKHYTSNMEYNLSYDKAKKILKGPIHRGTKYYYTITKIKTYKRTMIPFKYTEGPYREEKSYYSR